MATTVERASDTAEVPGFQRMTLFVSDRTMQLLQELSEQREVSIGEVLREAVALEKFYRDLRSHGGRIYVEQDGKTQELLSV